MIINSKTWLTVNRVNNNKKGKLITVEIAPGRSVKMYEADAIAQGLIASPPAQKMRKAPANKMREQPENKQEAADRVEPQTIMAEADGDGRTAATDGLQQSDDLGTIPGVGKASVRALAAHGVETFEALKLAQDLDYLPAKVLAAIAAWRAERG